MRMQEIEAKASNMDTLIAIGTTAPYSYSAVITFGPWLFPVYIGIF